MRILHLVSDEKFIPFATELFASIPDTKNSYLIVVGDSTKPLKYIRNADKKNIVDKHLIAKISAETYPHDAIVIHYLDALKIRIIDQLNTSAPIVWSGWGGDYYEAFTALRSGILGAETKKLDQQIQSALPFREKFVGVFRKIKRNTIDEFRAIKFIGKIDYFSAPIPNDFNVIKDAIPIKADYLQINYGSVEKTFDVGPSMAVGDDILVGNSASASNNHLEIFSALRKIDLGSRNVIVPLSYGCAKYRDHIIEAGRKIFGNKFIPMVDFVPLETYNTQISNCSLVVMGHRRQQAVGNIATMLYKGARIFIEQSTTTYQFLKSQGAIIFSMEDLAQARNDVTLLRPLSHDDQSKNAHVIDNFWGQQQVNDNARKFVARLRHHHSTAQQMAGQ